jgi:hypothetical protein
MKQTDFIGLSIATTSYTKVVGGRSVMYKNSRRFMVSLSRAVTSLHVPILRARLCSEV